MVRSNTEITNNTCANPNKIIVQSKSTVFCYEYALNL